jgi:hypothetical protein
MPKGFGVSPAKGKDELSLHDFSLNVVGNVDSDMEEDTPDKEL